MNLRVMTIGEGLQFYLVGIKSPWSPSSIELKKFK